jgi:hypothetical protein
MFVAHLSLACICLPPHHPRSQLTLTPTGRGALTPSVLHFFLVIHWCLGHQRGRPLCPGQLRRLNTVLWQMLLQSAFGCDNCSVSSIVPFRRPRSRSVTTSQLCTCHPILFITGGRSTSNWTFTSSANMLQWVSSTSSTFLAHSSSWTS